MSEDEKRPGFIRRAASGTGGYIAHRVMPNAIRENAVGLAKTVTKDAIESLKPIRVTRDEIHGGLNGRYDDGGHARFAELQLSEGLSEEDLRERHRRFRFLAKCYALASTVALLLLFASLFMQEGYFANSSLVFMSQVCFLLGAIALMARAVQFDYSAWQIEMRAFAGLKAYVDARLQLKSPA